MRFHGFLAGVASQSRAFARLERSPLLYALDIAHRNHLNILFLEKFPHHDIASTTHADDAQINAVIRRGSTISTPGRSWNNRRKSRPHGSLLQELAACIF